LVDGLLDLVDTLAIGGGLAATFVAASSTEAATATGWKEEGAVDASGSSGNNTQSAGTAEAQEAAGAAEARKRAKAWKNRWTGKGTAGKPRDPLDVVEAARRLLVKARKRGVEVILPSDFVVGDIEVDENGPLPGQVLSVDAGRDNDDEDNDNND
ncbi:unnamed protein product, partial [Ectocarpus sp. 12 AP-2014]